MKKYFGLILAISICFIFSITSFAASSPVEAPTIKTFVSGKQVKLSSALITVNGEMLANANELLPKLGVTNDSKHITLDKSKKNLVIISGKTTIRMAINNNKATVDKSSKAMNSAPILYKNKYYIPVKAAAELLGMKYAWDSIEKSLYIQKLSDYNKVKSILDKAVSTTKTANKYNVVYSTETQFNYSDQPSNNKNISTASMDKKNQSMYINSQYEDSLSDPSTGEYYLYNSYLYSKYSFNEKWGKELLSKKDYEEWILQYDVSHLKVSDILYCGLYIEENSKDKIIKLKGNVYPNQYSDLDKESESIDSFFEIQIDKTTNYIGKYIHKYSKNHMAKDDQFIYSSNDTYEYKDFNGNFTIPAPDESKMEFEEKDKSTTNNPPISLSKDEETVIAQLTSKVDKVPVDGAWEHPYTIGVTEAIMFIILQNQNDYDSFMKLSDEAKKVFVNQIVQDNYGKYIGCETIYGMVVYQSEMYAAVITGYDTAPENTTLEKYPDGEPVTVVVQDKKSNTYTDYQ